MHLLSVTQSLAMAELRRGKHNLEIAQTIKFCLKLIYPFLPLIFFCARLNASLICPLLERLQHAISRGCPCRD